MKKFFLFILICFSVLFAACAGRTSTVISLPDGNLTDEEYLTELGRLLERGMTADEVIRRIGEPDESTGIYDEVPFTAPFLIYWRGEYRLFVRFRGENKTSDYILLIHWLSDEEQEWVFHEDLKEKQD